MLHLDHLHRASLAGTSNGYKILKAVDMVNTKHQDLLEYGKFRIMSMISVDLYVNVRKQEEIVFKRFNEALQAHDKQVGIVKKFIESAMSLIKGYELVIKGAKANGLSKLDSDWFNFERSDGKEFYVVPNEDMKKILKMELKKDNLCIYSMEELAILISDDNIAYEFKSRFDAQVTKNEATSH